MNFAGLDHHVGFVRAVVMKVGVGIVTVGAAGAGLTVAIMILIDAANTRFIAGVTPRKKA